ncbi:MAG: polysaccharide deacetylase family protein, partial [Clostridia bacterium]|nr:polysaccharide deacetylase family protein [Clostridia bacterium]
MSYDDSVTSDIRLAKIMRQNGVRGTFNVITGRLAEPGSECDYPSGKWGYMTAKQCVDTYGDDMEMAVHTRDHFFLTRLPSARIAEQVLADRKALELYTKKPIRGLAYPYAAYNDEVVEVLKTCGICYARTVIGDEGFSVPSDWLRMHTTCHHDDPRLDELADSFFTPPGRYGQPKLFYLWG